MSDGRVAVVGAGWAGLSAAVTLCAAGRPVTLYDMAPQPGGRARSIDSHADSLDNGQHILIGAYSATLALMRQVGVEPEQVLHRSPLTLRYPDGRGLQLPAGPALWAFVRGVAGANAWTLAERAALLSAATGWLVRGFQCPPTLTVDQLCRSLPGQVRSDLIDPLCVAALNTSAIEASATVFLRVLRDALFSGPGAADLLLPRRPLSALLPGPACDWLAAAGARLRMGTRVMTLNRQGHSWAVDGEFVDQVILACTAAEASRLTQMHAPDWAACAAALRYEPIVTVYMRAGGVSLPHVMMALDATEHAPGQFLFDLGALGGPAGRLACVISGAQTWAHRGIETTSQAALTQVADALKTAGFASTSLTLERTLIEKRATFVSSPGLTRPPSPIARSLLAAGDYIAGPYPATLEGAVRSGLEAAQAALRGS